MYIIYTTIANYQAAENIANVLVAENIAACVNILQGMGSVFKHEGVLQNVKECVLLIKLSESCIDEAMIVIKDLHPYECPCILVMPVIEGYKPFIEWVDTVNPR